MTKPVIKMMNKHINAILWSELMSLNCSEISTYEKTHYILKNVQNVLGTLLKTILKFRNNNLYKNFYSKGFIILKLLMHYSGTFGGKININNTSENIKWGNL